MASARLIARAEALLIEALAALGEGIDLSGLARAEVAVMDDGGMGSLSIDPLTPRLHPLQVAALAEANDEDGVLLSLCLLIDQERRPRELDIWKVDFSPLLRLPEPSNLRPVDRTDRA